ncbi:hypothetical protein AB0H76_19475 [Nocardia sp. NPDC050712]|uniref:hypothetical protein n=1 Tax=Nocardia sp. NPDC050712 TaxID=3155518 RepID=UPI00340DE5DF
MGFAARQDDSTVAVRSRTRAVVFILLGLSSMVTMVVLVLVFALSKLAGVADSLVVPYVEQTKLSDSEAKDKMANLFRVDIPDNWHLIGMTSTCRGGAERLNICTFDGSFTGPASEFVLYPSLFPVKTPGAVDQPATQLVTCEGLATRNLLDLASDLDCASQQTLVLCEVNGGHALPGSNVLIAGSAAATTVRVRVSAV